jgi:6-phosphogluconolactonase (cycloisomerase 2 family)
LTPLPGTSRCLSFDRVDLYGRRGGCRRGTLGGAALVLSPDERFLYAMEAEGGIAGYRRNPRTGELRPLSGPGGCVGPATFEGIFDSEFDEAVGASLCSSSKYLMPVSDPALAISPDGRHLYASGGTAFGRHPDGGYGVLNGALSVFERDPANGRFRLAGCAAEAGADGCAPTRGLGRWVRSIVVAPDGRSVYVASLLVQGSNFGVGVVVFRRDPQTGAVEQLQEPVGCVAPLWHPGCSTARGFGEPSSYPALAMPADGRHLYLTATRGSAAFATDPATGALTQLPGAAGCATLTGDEGCAAARELRDISTNSFEMAFTPDGRYAYATFGFAGSGGVRALSRDVASGAVTALSGPGSCLSLLRVRGCGRARGLDFPSDIAVSSDGRSVYVAGANDALAVFSRRPADGTLAQPRGPAGCVGGTSNQLRSREPRNRRCARAPGVLQPVALAASHDGAYLYAAKSLVVAALARNAPKIRLRVSGRCPNRFATIAIEAYARVKRVQIELDGNRLLSTRRLRTRVALSRSLLGSRGRHRLEVLAVDVRGRQQTTRRLLRSCASLQRPASASRATSARMATSS